MALVQCPECKSAVSQSAAACPKCGFAISPGMGGCRKAFNAVAGCAILGGLLFCLLGVVIPQIAPPEGHARTRSEPSRPVAPAEPPIAVEAEQLVAHYDRNEVAADGYFKDHVLEVTGEVTAIGKDILDNPYVALSSGRANSFRQVQVLFTKEHFSVLAQLRKGMRVTLRGRCSGLMGNVLLNDGEFVR